MSGIIVRRLAVEEAEGYREIRLEALAAHPEAFASTLAAEGALPLAAFAERLRNSAVFAAFAGSRILGIAGFFAHEGEKQAHKGVFWGMYVRPAARRAGVGRQLVAAVLDHARDRVELIQLSVVVGNDPARRLYQSFGFTEYGIEKNALKHAGRYWDDALMALALSPGQGRGPQ
jgi:ribosomal protein S18 acetylase RimI-like enzyme